MLAGSPRSIASPRHRAQTCGGTAGGGAGDRLGGLRFRTSVLERTASASARLQEGWLEKRGPVFGFRWEARWCVLHPEAFLYYTDESRRELRGEVPLSSASRAFAFRAAGAPGEAVKHKHEKEFGFVLDAEPAAGRHRRLFYFGAPSEAALGGWLDAFAHAARQAALKEREERRWERAIARDSGVLFFSDEEEGEYESDSEGEGGCEWGTADEEVAYGPPDLEGSIRLALQQAGVGGLASMLIRAIADEDKGSLERASSLCAALGQLLRGAGRAGGPPAQLPAPAARGPQPQTPGGARPARPHQVRLEPIQEGPSKGPDRVKLDCAVECDDLRTVVKLMASEEAMEPPAIPLHPWAAAPQTVGALAAARVAMLAAVAEQRHAPEALIQLWQAGAFPQLAQALKSGEEPLEHFAAIALSLSTAASKECCVAAQQAGVPHAAVRHLHSPVEGMRAAAAVLMCNMWTHAEDGQEVARMFLEHGGAAALVDQLCFVGSGLQEGTPLADIYLERVLNLQDFIEDAQGAVVPERALAAIDAGALDRLRPLATFEDEDVREVAQEALRALEEVAADRDRAHVDATREAASDRGAQDADFERYVGLPSLLATVRLGAARLLRGPALAERLQAGKPLLRRQDLEREAPELFWDPAELAGRLEVCGSKLILVSHCWQTPEHPEPTGASLRALGRALELWGAAFSSEAAVFFDWCCLPQRPRTGKEQPRFDKCLADMDLWYGHQRTSVWLLTETPEGAPQSSDRGWPTFELAAASLLKAETDVLDISRLGESPGVSSWWDLVEACRANLPPPVLAEEDVDQLLCGKAFSVEPDRAVALRAYRRLAAAVRRGAGRLALAGRRWGPADAGRLGTVLPTCTALTLLDLSRNALGSEGAAALSRALPECRALERLLLGGNGIADEGAEALAAAVRAGCPQLVVLNLSDNLLGPAGRLQLESAWRAAGKAETDLHL